MGRPEKFPLEVPAAVGVGSIAYVFRFLHKTVQVTGAFTGQLQIEGSIEADEFTPIGAALGAPGFVLVPQSVAYLRVRVVELTAGHPRATMAGFDDRAM